MLRNNRSIKITLLLTVTLFIIAGESYTQIAINSPYSRYGLGDLAYRKNAYNFSMGGVAYAVSNPRFVNPFNPASNTAFDSLSFVFSGGIIISSGQLKTENLSNPTNYATLGYLLFGFPITHWLKSSIGIIPYSNVGYNIRDVQVLDDIGNTEFLYQGSGGINQFYYNAGIQLHKNFSIGAMASYMFGKANLSRAVYFPDSVTMLNTRIDNYIEVGDLYFEFGAQYNKKIAKDLKLGIGAVFAPSQNIKAVEDYLARSYFGTSSGIEYYRDTLEQRIENKGNLLIPEKYGIGFMLQKPGHWMVAADFGWQNWSKYETYGVADSLANDMHISVGGEYIPNPNSVVGYWKRVTYRAGFRFNKTYLDLQNTQINEFGMSFGFGFPIPRSLSSLNLGFEIGKRGTTTSGLIQENYFKFTLGVDIWQRWFVKPKYN
nr:hypothetical protein [Bacteroidota bacterium]